MDLALAFYRDFVGLRPTVDQEERRQDGSSRRAVYLAWSDSTRSGFLVLDQSLGVPAPGAPAQLYDLGLHHLGFTVDDLDEVLTQAADQGVPVRRTSTEPGPRYGEPGEARIRTALTTDPDGNIIQFDQWL
jgi:catechol 2,3-dioxygenase-like lactoylglutathione lyase family enzyme